MRRRRKNPIEERFRRPGANVRVIKRFLDGRIRVTYSDGKSKTFRKNPTVAYNVYLDGKLIDTVFQSGNSDADEVKRSLVNHDGYDPGIVVKKERKSKSRANPPGRIGARGFTRVRRSVTPQFLAAKTGVPVNRILTIIGR